MTATDAPVSPSKKRRSPLPFVLLGLGCVALGGIAFMVRRDHASTAQAAAASASAQARPVPVTVAKAEVRDVPVVLEGLGTVTPLAMVTVKTQVDGRLDRVVFKEGDNVKKGELLAQVDARPFAIQLRQAQAALASNQATLKNAELTLNRNKALVADQIVSQQEVENAAAQVETARAQQLGNQAAIDSARLNIDYSQIRSPIEGVTGVRLVDPGNIVHQSDQNGIVVVTQIDPIGVIFSLPQDELARVAAELAKGQLRVELVSRNGDTSLGQGTLSLIDNQVNAQTSTIRLKATIPNPERKLWPNAFVKAKLFVATKKNALVIPSAAVQRGPQGAFVYLVGPDGSTNIRPVQVDRSDNDLTIVTQGLVAGDTVVTDGQNQIKPGGKVIPKPAATAGAPGGISGEGASPAPTSGSPRGDRRTRGGAAPSPTASAAPSASAFTGSKSP